MIDNIVRRANTKKTVYEIEMENIQTEDDVMRTVHRIKNCIINKYYDHAHELIRVLTDKGVIFTVEDAEYLAWLEKKNDEF